MGLLTLLPAIATAQIPARDQHAIDSLLQVVRVHPADTNGARALVSLMYYTMYNDTTEAGRYGRQAVALATRLHDTRRLARIHYNMGTFTSMQGRPQVSIAHHLASARYFLALNNPLWAGHNYRSIGSRYNGLGQYEMAMRYQLRSLRLREAAHDTASMADSYTSIGQVYLEQRNYPAAQKAYEQSLRYWQYVGVTYYVIDCLNHLGIIHRDMGHYDRAQHYLYQGLGKAKSAGDSSSVGELLVSLGVLEQKQRHWAASLVPLLRVERIYKAEAIITPEAWSDLLSVIGESYVQTGQLAKAEPYLQRALVLSRQTHARAEEADALEGLGMLAAARGNLNDAYEYQRTVSLIKDTLRSDAAARSVAELQTKYETEKKDARNRIQALQLSQQSLMLRKRNIQLLLGALGAVLLAVLGWLLYNRQRLHEKMAREQERQRLERQHSEAVLQAEETERRRIGADLHDGVGQLLSVAKLNLNALCEELRPQTSPDQQQRFSEALEVVDESVREVRGISHNLMPNALIKHGLGQAVREFLNKIHHPERLRIHVETLGLDERLDPTLENVLYRIIQELVQNIIKHAQATELTLQLIRHDSEVTVLVEDNGIGFDVAARTNQADAGIGLRNVASRVAYLRGSVHIDSQPGHGTSITVEVPLSAAATSA